MITPPENLSDDQIEVWQQALEYFHRALALQKRGDLGSALRDYRNSIALFPTPEAHTFLGWCYARLHLIDQAIAECHKAIALDADYGNPYNDIGAYLIDQGHLSESALWLERAKAARRYTTPEFPRFNLGRIHEKRRNLWLALDAYEDALALKPGYREARQARERVLGRLS